MEKELNRKETIEAVMNLLKREIVNPPKLGGQSCGIISQKVKLVSEECNVSIEIGYHRSQIKNYELARTIMEITIEELIK